ncbi:hypothetical protein BJX99DRAFT_174895 [Aspergillus californicus]
MADEPPFTREIARSILAHPVNPFYRIEEQQHPWGTSFPRQHAPFMRIWDGWSGSQPTENNRLLSRLAPRLLDTRAIRKEYLTIHADHSIWKDTPFISFTDSPDEVESLVQRRESNRGPQTLTVINPNVRRHLGLPVLHMGSELIYYGIPDPYSRNDAYYKRHYLCLFEVTAQEIVGHWDWDDLDGNWYQDVILPAFLQHDRAFTECGLLDMSSLTAALPVGSNPRLPMPSIATDEEEHEVTEDVDDSSDSDGDAEQDSDSDALAV